ncbi:BUB3-interacting and GLEBS motif-containing protein ZNF207-like [Artemia franciscana]|uniref:BED-type domain-containing protein n=1 Tax=Artemia franciscana TaxID=6661 RepID=A0AA88HZ91_ARTSF|nr:hypothetical protein QYM36_007185 [Artemia franciscana]KAK2716950.1 hypothetical protein QYM36_007185 [Artemia franciscana]KAK2716951.1 hypothetical protein QYM36_007185 [Artemia franciscana]KAK2716952.1 hypothetical protein QYM36_007185 [Artemia franciscana]
MGRKKKKMSKPWCWYCNREFDDEKILIQHQKAKHFKCHVCHKKLYTGPGLAIHCMQVHKETLDKIPNSLPNRTNTELEVYGMEGIPDEDLKNHEKNRASRAVAGSGSEDEEEPSPKVARTGQPPGVVPGMMNMMPGVMNPYIPQGIPGMGGSPLPIRPAAPLPQGGPRPLFPAAGQAAGPSGIESPGHGAAGIRPTFPAYSASPLPEQKKPSLIVVSSATSRIMHPEEDVSLEEKRARIPKYLVNFPKKETPVPKEVAPSPPAPAVPSGHMPQHMPQMNVRQPMQHMARVPMSAMGMPVMGMGTMPMMSMAPMGLPMGMHVPMHGMHGAGPGVVPGMPFGGPHMNFPGMMNPMFPRFR